MSMQDPIADALTRIRNAQHANKKVVEIPYSKIKESIVKILFNEGYIDSYKKLEKNYGTIEAKLKYYKGKGVAELLERVSKPSLRKYVSAKKMPSVMNGLGIVVVSTSKGVMTGKEATKIGLGGEILCYIA